MTQPVPAATEAATDGEPDARAGEGPPRLALRASLTRLSVRPRSILLLAAVPLIAIAAGIVGWVIDWRLGVDSAVYRAGALTLLNGDPLYESNTLSTEPWWALLPFTYPPTAALFFIPLAFMPIQIAWGVLTAVSVLAMALVVRIAIGSLPPKTQPRQPQKQELVGLDDAAPRWWDSPARATLVFSVVLLGLEPVWRTIFLGQINLILMALIMLDILVISARGSRWGGVLVGIASAVKLTPLPFIAHLLFTGKWKDALRALATFILLQALMFVIVPSDAWRYWTHTLPDTGRIGPLHWAGNQSLNGLMNRLTDLAPWASKGAYVVGALLAIPAIWLMLRFHRQGQRLAALLVTAFWVLLVSPVSWSHHWVWAVPLIVLLVSRLPRSSPAAAWRRWLAAGAVLAVFLSGILLILPNGRNIELHWEVWQFVLGSAYILVPIVLVLVLAARWLVLRRRADRDDRVHASTSS